MGSVRQARPPDLSGIIDQFRQFHEASGIGEFVPLDEAATTLGIWRLLNSDKVAIFVAEEAREIVGIASVVLCPVWYTSGVHEASELFWWVAPEHRGNGHAAALHEAMTLWARQEGAALMQMGSLDGMKADVVGRLYRRWGYRPRDRLYVKAL